MTDARSAQTTNPRPPEDDAIGDEPQKLECVHDLNELVHLAALRTGLFLRYSLGPRDDWMAGHSRDHEADVALPGWSVTTLTPEPWWPLPPRLWVARRLCKYVELGEEHGRFAWVLTGRVVGHGPDHEPLVVEIVPLARVPASVLAQARDEYRAHFHVGSDSTGQ